MNLALSVLLHDHTQNTDWWMEIVSHSLHQESVLCLSEKTEQLDLLFGLSDMLFVSA